MADAKAREAPILAVVARDILQEVLEDVDRNDVAVGGEGEDEKGEEEEEEEEEREKRNPRESKGLKK